MGEEPGTPTPYVGPERRRRPRSVEDTLDWESRALRRVAERLALLDESQSGWERAVLRRLRHLLDDSAHGE